MNNVTFLTNSLVAGGAERVLSVVANRLAEEGKQVEIILLEQERFYPLHPSIKVTNFSNGISERSTLLKLFMLPFWALKLSRHVREHNIDLIQSHVYRANFVNLLSKLFGASHKAQVVEVIAIDFFRSVGFNGLLNLLFIRKLYKYADRVVCKANRMKISLQDYLPYKINATIIYNPYNIDVIEKKSQEGVSHFEFKAQKRYVATVGRLNNQKNHKMIMDSMVEMPDDVELIIIGSGELLNELEGYAARLHLQERVHFMGQQENPFSIIAKCDLFVLASNQEGFPNVLVEAMLCRVPVVSTDCVSGPREILAAKSDLLYQLQERFEVTDYGILTPVNKPDVLAGAITFMLNEPAKAQTMATNAYQRARDFSVDEIIKHYKEVLCVE